jgi:hypothetical protein
VAAYRQLLASILRLDTDDPVEGRRRHIATLQARAEALAARRVRKLRRPRIRG